MKKLYEEPQCEVVLLKQDGPVLTISTEGFKKFSNGTKEDPGEDW